MSAADSMRDVIALLAPTFKSAKFKKRHHTFNRPIEPGLVHVVNFQLGQFPIGQYEIPGFRPNLYGKFTVNLGVFAQEIFEATLQRPSKPFVQEYDCEFRVRLSGLFDPPRDQWWSFERPPGELASELEDHLQKYASNWFARYSSRDAILQNPFGGDRVPGWPRRGPVALAIMQAHRGEKAKARELLRAYLLEERRDPRNPRHREWVLELAARLGFEASEVE